MNWRQYKLLHDIITAISNIEAHTAGIANAEQFDASLLELDAVLYKLTVLGEATRRLRDEEPALLLGEYRRIIGMRNIILHNYEEVSSSLVWAVVKDQLPVLRAEVELLLKT
jgi:uncharacterized protein with HEPN domain